MLIASIDRPLQVSNQTASDFEAIYTRSAQDKDWNGNLLSNGIALEPGATVKVRFPGKENSAKWDLSIVDEAGLSERFSQCESRWRRTLVNPDGKIRAVVQSGRAGFCVEVLYLGGIAFSSTKRAVRMVNRS